MRRLPWHVSLRADRKAILTALGISLGVAFSVVGFALVSGLEGETISQEGRFAEPDVILAASDGGTFDARDLDGPELVVLLIDAVRADGTPLTLAGLEGPRAPALRPGAVHPVAQEVEGALALAHPQTQLPIAEPIDDATLARGWYVMRADELRTLARLPDGAATYAIVEAAPSRGAFLAMAAPGVEPFFRSSGIEVARDLGLLVTFSSSLVGLFAYEFLRTEVNERRRELGLWRAIGMRAKDVTALLVARGAFITAIGSCAGFALAFGLLGAASNVSSSGVFRGALGPALTSVLLLVFMFAGVLGAAVPAIQAGHRPVRESLEAAV